MSFFAFYSERTDQMPFTSTSQSKTLRYEQLNGMVLKMASSFMDQVSHIM